LISLEKILSDEKLFTRQWGEHETRSRSFRCSAPAFIQPMPTFEFSSIVQNGEKRQQFHQENAFFGLFKWPRSAMRAPEMGNRSRQNHRRHPVIKRQLTKSKK
jgi:hypothetical protein